MFWRKDSFLRLQHSVFRNASVARGAKKEIFWSEMKESVRRSIVRIETQSTQSRKIRMEESRDHFQAYMSNSNSYFEEGKFAEHKHTVLAAANIQRETAIQTGLDLLNIGIWDSEVTGSIGHTALALGNQVALQQLGLTDEKQWNAIYSRVANSDYLNQWGRHFTLHKVSHDVELSSQKALWPIREGVSFVSTKSGPLYANSAWSIAETAREEGKLAPYLTLSGEERERGNNFMFDAGLPKNAWFATLHVRENSNDGIRSPRNARIQDYIPAISEITKAGGWVVRIGDKNSTALPSLPRVIDLTVLEGRPTWVDVYLLSSCAFMVGTSSGPAVAAMTFGTPVLWTNLTGLCYMPFCSKTIMIPKLVRLRESGSLLSVQGVISAGFGWLESLPSPKTILGEKYEWSDNSAQDILSGVQEMLESRYKESPTARQALFSEAMKDHNSEGGPPRCSEAFLTQHSN